LNNHPKHQYYAQPSFPRPPFYDFWLKRYDVTQAQAVAKLHLDGVLSADTDQCRERVWAAACRRAMRQKKKDADAQRVSQA